MHIVRTELVTRNAARWCGLVLLILLAPATARAANSWTWREVNTPHFNVISADTEGTTKTIAWQFEQVRAVVETIWPWATVQTDRPVTIIAAPDERALAMLMPQFAATDRDQPGSIFLTAADRHYIIIRSDRRAGNADGINPFFSAYWSYLSLVLSTNVRAPLPLWYRRGASALFANTSVRADEVQIGRTFPPFLQALASHQRMHLRELVVADERSIWATDRDRRGVMDAQSSMLVHFLLFGASESPDSTNVNRFVAALTQGTSPLAAFEEAFGPPDKLEEAFTKYLTNRAFKFGRLKADIRVDQTKLNSRTLFPEEAAAMTAVLHASTGRLVEASADLEAARLLNPGSVMVKDAEGRIFEATKQWERAQAAFDAATRGGSTNFYTYFRATNLPLPAPIFSGRDGLLRRAALLDRSLALNDHFLPSLSAASTTKTLLGLHADALALAQRAALLDPRGFATQTMLARALAADAQPAPAIVQARYAATLAMTDPQRQSTKTLIDKMVADATAALPPLPSPIPLPEGAVRVGGAITAPTKTKDAALIYPELAKAAGVDGIVILETVVGADGRVKQARVLRSIPLLDRAAIAVVEQCEYQPTIVDGRAVPIIFTVTINFARQ